MSTSRRSMSALVALLLTLPSLGLFAGSSAAAETATQIAVQAGNDQSAPVGSAVATQPSVVVKDVNNNPVSGVEVTFAVASGGGTIDPASPETVATDANGVAALRIWTLGATAGANTLTATITGSDPAISTTFTATAFSIPGAPGALLASPGNGSVDLVWSPPSDLGGGVTSYEVQSSGGSQETSFGSGVHTSARFTGLTNGAVATFQVRAVNPAGAGPWSEAVTAVPQASSVKGWSWVSELSADDAVAWRGLVFADGQFTAVGTDAVMRSPTGQTWTLQAAPPAGAWTGIAFGEGVLVATATGGADRVMRSTDNGVTWSAVTPPEANAWWSVAYGDGVFVAVASSGTNRVMRSEDAGITWDPIAGIAGQEWFSVTYGNGAFVAVGVGTDPVMRSTDGGRTWSSATAPASNSWFSVTYGNGVFVAIGQGTPGTQRAIRSVDGGLTWTAQVTPAVNWRAVAYGEGVFVGTKTNFGVNIRSEDDGETWVRVDEPPLPNGSSLSREWRSVAFGNETFVALATTGASHRVIRSVDLESIEVVGGNDGTATVNTAVAVPPSVLVKNVLGNPVPSVLVSFRVTAGDGTLTEADAVTDASGIATVGSWTLGTTVGTNTLTATVAGLPPVTFSATGTGGPATQIAISAGNNQSAVAGTAVTTAPSVVVRDGFGNPVPEVEVTFAVASGGGTIDPASSAPVTTDADGVATLRSWTLGVTAGVNTLTASIVESDPAIEATFTATAVTVPSAPRAVVATPGTGSVDLNWTLPSDTGGGVRSDGDEANAEEEGGDDASDGAPPAPHDRIEIVTAEGMDSNRSMSRTVPLVLLVATIGWLLMVGRRRCREDDDAVPA